MINTIRKVFDTIHKLRFILSREQKLYYVNDFGCVSNIRGIYGDSLIVGDYVN